MYASRVEPEAQRPLDSPSNGLPLNLFAIFGWPLGDSGFLLFTWLTVVGALSRVIIVVEGHLQFSCAVRRWSGQNRELAANPELKLVYTKCVASDSYSDWGACLTRQAMHSVCCRPVHSIIPHPAKYLGYGRRSSLFSVPSASFLLFQKGRAIANFWKAFSTYKNPDCKLPHVCAIDFLQKYSDKMINTRF